MIDIFTEKLVLSFKSLFLVGVVVFTLFLIKEAILDFIKKK